MHPFVLVIDSNQLALVVLELEERPSPKGLLQLVQHLRIGAISGMRQIVFRDQPPRTFG